MDTGQDAYNQRLNVRFSQFVPQAVPRWWRHLLDALWQGFSAFSVFFARLRKVVVDLVVSSVVVVAVVLFVNVLTDDAVVIEAPSVPQRVQDLGVTPTLLSQMVKAQIERVHEVASRPETPLPMPGVPEPEIANTARTLEDVINSIFSKRGDGARATGGHPRTVEAGRILEEAFGLGTSPLQHQAEAGRSANDPDSLAARMDQLLQFVTDELQQAIKLNKPSEVSSPVEPPLVVAAAGLQLSITSFARRLRSIVAMENDRRFTMAVVCKTEDCRSDSLSLHVATKTGVVVLADVVDLDVSRLDRAVDTATRHLLETFDRQLLATFYYKEGDLDEAKRLAQRILRESHNHSVWAANLLGLVALRRGRLSEAGEYFGAAMELDPTYASTRINIGIVHFHRGELEEAKAQYEEALSFGGDKAIAYNNLGNVLARQCDWQGAATAYQQALTIDPHFSSAGRGLELVKSFPIVRSSHFSALSKISFSAARPSVKVKPSTEHMTLADVMAVSKFCEGAGTKAEPK